MAKAVNVPRPLFAEPLRDIALGRTNPGSSCGMTATTSGGENEPGDRKVGTDDDVGSAAETDGFGWSCGGATTVSGIGSRLSGLPRGWRRTTFDAVCAGIVVDVLLAFAPRRGRARDVDA
jgi:hypothetical protein